MPYPVVFEADYAVTRSRVKAVFRSFLAFPLFLLVLAYGIVGALAVVCAWFAIVITGRYPEGLYRFVARATRFTAQATAYNALLTDVYPSLSGEDDPAYPIRMHFAGPQPRYSRMKTLFRGLLQVPLLFLRNTLQALLNVGAVGAWFCIVFTGRLPRGLFGLLVLATSYIARSDAYIYLLTETYPPFQDDATRMAGVVPAV